MGFATESVKRIICAPYRMLMITFTLIGFIFVTGCNDVPTRSVDVSKRPHVILIMADDMGWAQTGYYGHPILKTPNLDAMAEMGCEWIVSMRVLRAVRPLEPPCLQGEQTIGREHFVLEVI